MLEDVRRRRIRGLFLKATIVVAIAAGCSGTPASPTPSPTPTPPLTGAAHATAFENLALVQSLERASGRQTRLVALRGVGIDLDGRVTEGNSWTYTFSGVTSGGSFLYSWDVRDGAIEFHSGPPVLSYDDTELGPVMKVDSPEAIRLALAGGVDRFIQKHPTAIVRLMTCNWLGRQPTWYVNFRDLVSLVPCEPQVWLNAETGAILSRNVDCDAFP